jgi:alkylation response protein AidB-like acyl-CoA dehydrogenase
MQLGQGYYKLLDPKYKYSRCYCADEEIEIAANVARFVDKELMPERHNFEGGWHRDEKLATETRNKYYAECVRMGLTKTSFPKKLGAELGYDTTGLGLSPILRNMVYEELCRAEVGLAMEVMHIHWPVSFMIAAKRDDMLKEFGHQILGDECWMACVAITERAGGANLEDPAFDFRTIRTTLKFDGDDAIVNGVKIWPGTSGPPDRFVDQYLKGHLGYWTIVTRDPSKGSEAAGIVYVPPDAKGFSVSPPYQKMGLCWQDENCELFYDNVRVPKRYVLDLDQPGLGGKIIKGYCIGLGRLGVSSRLVGMSEAVLKIALDWTGGRDIAGVPVRERSYFASILGEMAKRIEVARNYMLMCSWQVAHPEEYGTPDSPEMIAKFSAARSFAGNTCEFCCNRAMEMMGSYGYSYDYHVEKYMRDYKIIQMVLGGAQRDILDIAQGLYGPFMWSGMDEWIKQGGLVTEGFDGPRY